MKNVICAVAGGSGGHIIPGIVTMQSLKDSDTEILFFITDTALDRDITSSYNSEFTYCYLSLEPAPGKRFWRYPFFFYRLMQATIESFKILRTKKPESVMAMGGLISVPVCLAAWMLNIRVVLFELNAIPGKAVQWLAPFADTIFVCFEEAGAYFKKKSVAVVPYPHRFNKKSLSVNLQLDPAKKTILVLGGSQGSYGINHLLRRFVEELSDDAQHFTILHQTGSYPYEQESPSIWFDRFYKKHAIDARVFDFSADLQTHYHAADVIVCRAGAGTLFEIEHFNKQALLVPLEYAAQGHQVDNAFAMIKRRSDLFTLIRQHQAQKSLSLFKERLTMLINRAA